MKRILVIILYFSLIAFISHAQIPNVLPPKFDIANFEKHQVSGDYVFTLDNGDRVRQYGDKSSGFVEEIEQKSTPYGYHKEFFPNGILKKAGPTFYEFGIGIHRSYNEKGKLVDSINIEKHFSFSINQLIKEVDSLYHINLLDKSHNNVRLYVILFADRPNPFYFIYIPVETAKDSREIEISGTNGQVLSDKIVKRQIKPTE